MGTSIGGFGNQTFLKRPTLWPEILRVLVILRDRAKVRLRGADQAGKVDRNHTLEADTKNAIARMLVGHSLTGVPPGDI